MKKYLPYLAIIVAALLWSVDAFLRQSLYSLSPLLIITIEHGIGSLLFIPILNKYWVKIKILKQTGWVSIPVDFIPRWYMWNILLYKSIRVCWLY